MTSFQTQNLFAKQPFGTRFISPSYNNTCLMQNQQITPHNIQMYISNALLRQPRLQVTILAALVKCQSTFRGKPWLSKIVACHSLAHQWYRSVTLRVHIRHKNVCAPSSHMHCNDHHLQLQCDTKNRLASTATHTEKIQEKHKESLPNHALNILHNIEYITSYITILPVI